MLPRSSRFCRSTSRSRTTSATRSCAASCGRAMRSRASGGSWRSGGSLARRRRERSPRCAPRGSSRHARARARSCASGRRWRVGHATATRAGRATGQIYTAGERSEITTRGHGRRRPRPSPWRSASRSARRRSADGASCHEEAGPVGDVELVDARGAGRAGAAVAEALAHPRRARSPTSSARRVGARASDAIGSAPGSRTTTRPTALALGDGPAAVLVVHHTAFDAAGEPIEFAEAVYPPDRWSFEDEYPIAG